MERSPHGIEDEAAGMSISLESGTTGNPTVDGISMGAGRFASNAAGAAAGALAGTGARGAVLAGKVGDRLAKIPTPYETAEEYFKRAVGVGAMGVFAAIILGGVALYFLAKHSPSVAKVTAEFAKGAKGFASAVKPG
jgi:hypothetical protein